jgi:hypothetical protein
MRLGIGLSEESLDAEMAQARSGSPWVSLSRTSPCDCCRRRRGHRRRRICEYRRLPGADSGRCFQLWLRASTFVGVVVTITPSTLADAIFPNAVSKLAGEGALTKTASMPVSAAAVWTPRKAALFFARADTTPWLSNSWG